MFRLQRRAVDFTRIRDEGGQKSLSFEVNTALRIHSTHPAASPAIGGRMFFKPLTFLGPVPITSLANHTEPGLSSTLLPAPQKLPSGGPPARLLLLLIHQALLPTRRSMEHRTA